MDVPYDTGEYRRYLACALLGQGVSGDKICALLRWASSKSLMIYAKLMPKDYASTIASAAKTDIDLVMTNRLPIYDSFQVATNLINQSDEFEELAGRPDTADDRDADD